MKREQLWESLHDPELRKQLIDEHINVGIAFQIRSLRNRQNLTQAMLAEKLGGKKKQPLVAEWEDPNYGKYTLGTLKELAKAFDVGLLVRFVPFSTMVDWTIDLNKDVIAPPSFSEDQYHITTEMSSILKGTLDVDANKVNFTSSARQESIQTSSSFLYSSYFDAPAKESDKELVHA